MSYREVIVKSGSGKNEGKDVRVNIDKILYYRDFIFETKDGEPRLETIIYLESNPHGLRVMCTPDWLSRKIKFTVDLSSLSKENYQKALDYIKNLS